jgi:two-component system, chemotaxis family, protein-glutamate methylesterase/glutaminase
MNDARKLIEATCPMCHGSLGEIRADGGASEFVCVVGHQYSAQALVEAHWHAQKRALWAAVLALEEAVNVANAAVRQFPEEAQTQLRAKAERRRVEQAAVIRKILTDLENPLS